MSSLLKSNFLHSKTSAPRAHFMNSGSSNLCPGTLRVHRQRKVASKSTLDDGVVAMVSEKLKGIADETISAGKKIGEALEPYDPIDLTQKAFGNAQVMAVNLKGRWAALSVEDRSAAKTVVALVILGQLLVTALVEVLDDLPFFEDVVKTAAGAALAAYLYSAFKTPERRARLKASFTSTFERITGISPKFD